MPPRRTGDVIACACLVLGALVTACDADTAPSVGPNGMVPALESIVAAQRTRVLQCPWGPYQELNEQTCARTFFGCGAKLEQVRASDVTKCVAAIQPMDCSETWPPRGAGARSDYLGTCELPLPAGEVCTGVAECEGLTICSTDKVCEPPRPSGATCKTERGWDCSGDCIANVCRDASELRGSECGGGVAGECGRDLRCVRGEADHYGQRTQDAPLGNAGGTRHVYVITVSHTQVPSPAHGVEPKRSVDDPLEGEQCGVAQRRSHRAQRHFA